MVTHRTFRIVLAALFALPLTLAAQDQPTGRSGRGQTPANPIQEGLPLKPERVIKFTTDVGSWMSLDVSPDGRTIAIGDEVSDAGIRLYDADGGNRTVVPGSSRDTHPAFSPDVKQVCLTRD